MSYGKAGRMSAGGVTVTKFVWHPQAHFSSRTGTLHAGHQCKTNFPKKTGLTMGGINVLILLKAIFGGSRKSQIEKE
jgi:hypothetical protein